ncbi:MAG TPA: magnesium/cobalt transporter CorA [Longimicrobiaceae bacterium]|nr:magnesium/cobalt transporter CorA [Longimicrobiaceae bacterium]
MRESTGTAPVESEAKPVIWIDLSNPGEAEAAYLREELGFHPLAVEDCIRGRQRPKLDRYHGYFFLVAYSAGINEERKRMALNEFHLFLGANYIVTVHDHRVDEVKNIVARWRTDPRIFRDVGSLAHALLDSIVDDYFPVLEHYSESAELLEASVFDMSARGNMQKILGLRHELVLLRRVVAPMRDVVSSLVRRDLPFLRPELLPYFQDVHDHCVRVTEEIDALREILAALLDAQLSNASNRLNQTLRIMTAWSIILMSMTLVAGIYGMNFDFMPELGWRWGYFGALALMAVIGGSLVAFFRRWDWL